MDNDYEEDFYEDGSLTEGEILEIQEAYRRQKVKENLIGPAISTMVHVCLLIMCATFFVGETVVPNPTVEITPVVEEVPAEEPPPPPPPHTHAALELSTHMRMAKAILTISTQVIKGHDITLKTKKSHQVPQQIVKNKTFKLPL